MVVFVGNEGEEAHVILSEATVDDNPSYGHLPTSDNSDADKCGIVGFNKVFKTPLSAWATSTALAPPARRPRRKTALPLGLGSTSHEGHDAAQDRTLSLESSRPEAVTRGGAGRRRDRKHFELPPGELGLRGAQRTISPLGGCRQRARARRRRSVLSH
jgi:hypothetical protein